MAAAPISNPPPLFLHFTTPEQVATHLGVPVGAIFCTEISKGETCGVDDCKYPALRRNCQRGHNSGPRCCVHCQNWFPTNQGKTNTRGHYLLGPQYLRPPEETAGRNACICADKNCLGIGYSPYMVSVTSDPSQHGQVVQAICGSLHSTDPCRKAIVEKLNRPPRDVRIAPWHFHPNHRQFDADSGTWRLKPYSSTQVFVDKENKKWHGMSPPNYSPSKFLSDEVGSNRILPKDRLIVAVTGSNMPSWIREYRKLELPAVSPMKSVDLLPTDEKGLLPIFSLSGGERNVNHAARQAMTAAVQLEKRKLESDLDVAALKERIETLLKENALLGNTVDTLQIQKCELTNEVTALKNVVASEQTISAELRTELQNMWKDSFFSYKDLGPKG